MSAALEPVTRQRLEQFRRRQQMLQAVRGLALATIFASVVLLVVVAIDAGWVIPQTARWLLSIAIYATLLGWLAGTLIRVSKRVSLPATARVLEQLEPRLQQRLLAAVELSQDHKAQHYTSNGFRAQIQRQVAQAVEPVSTRLLLPWSMLTRVLLLLLLLAMGLIGLSFIPGLHWPHRVARALLPGANLGRITRFQIEIISPKPASTMMPSGDVAAIEARVRGPMPDNVQLETRIDGVSDYLSMRRVVDSPNRNSRGELEAKATQIDPADMVYVVNLQLGPQVVEYRVLVEDAHTPWHRLTTRARPQVLEFHKTIIYPAYSGLADVHVSASDGDIEALKGSRIHLEIVADQSISRATLKISLPEQATPKTISMAPVGKPEVARFAAEFQVESDSTYRIELEAAETKFTNAFSRAYQIHGLDDMPPRLVWENPEASMLVVEPNQLVPMTIHVQDELPLGDLSIISSINGELPTAVAIQTPKEADCSVKCELDLMALKPRLGDTVRVLFQATDRQGQATASTPVELVISSTSVDPDRRPATEQRIELASELRKFSEQVQPQAKRIRNLQEQVIKSQSDADLSELKQAADQLAEQARSVAKQLREKVASHLKQPQDSVSLAELERTGQVLARIESDIGKELAETTSHLEDPLPDEPTGELRDRINRTRSSSDKLSDAVGVIDRRFREFVAHDVLAEVARGMNVVQGFQRQLAIRSDEIPPAQLKRRQAVVARQLRELEQIMIDRSPLLREGASHSLRGWIEWSGQLAERIERAAADGDDNPNFKEFTKQIANEVDAHQSVMNVDGGLAGEINNGRKDLDARSQSAAQILQDLAKSMSAKQRDPDGVAPVDESMNKIVASGLDHLQHRKELQQARSDSDPHHSSDLGNAIRATKLLMEKKDASLVETSQRLAATAGALKRLEAVHNVNEANKHLSDLEQIERWDANSVDARTESPRAWDALHQRLEQSSRALREAGIDGKLADELDALRLSNPSTEASQKIGDRRWTGETRVSAERELSQMRGQLDSTRVKLDAIARAARAELNGYAPTVSDLARRAADQTRQLQDQTKQLSKAAAADEVPDLKSRMDQLTAEQKETVAPIDDLRDALTEMAAMQDLLEDDQRSLARDADTSQHIIEKANEQIAQSLEPAAAAESPAAAAAPLEKAATTQGEASQALEQIADHFDKLKSGNLPEGELADSRSALKKLASNLDMASMEQWYKTAESLAKLAGTDPEKVMKRLEDELKGNARMRDELSDIAKRAVNESVQSLNFSADQERTLQSQLELSDPQFFVRKSLLQTDIHAASERIRELMQQLSNDASNVAGRANAREQQKVLSELQQLVQATVTKASTARDSLPLEELERMAQSVMTSLTTAQSQFGAASEKLQASSDELTHASDQELRNRKREMEDWERRTLQQQARGAQAIERSHDQRARQADNDVKRLESSQRNAQRQREDVQKQLELKPDNKEFKRRLAESEQQLKAVESELKLAEAKRQNLKDRLETAKQAQIEMSARKPNELIGKNPTAELAGRLANNAAETSKAIAKELQQALADSQWMNQLEVADSQLQAAGKTQGRVEQSVQDVADNLHRAARHESRLEHPQSSALIVSQAGKVEEARMEEVHTANERLSLATQQAKALAAPDAPGRASADTSMAARGAVSDAEVELRERVLDLKKMLERPKVDETAGDDKEPPMDAKTSVPLDPKMLARMLDELDRQMTEVGSQQPEEGEKTPPKESGDAGKSQDENNASDSQQGSPNGKKKGSQKGSQTASMQEAAQQLAQEMNRQRAQGRQSTAASRMSSNSADTKAAPPSAVRVLSVDRRTGNDWGKLREQAAEQTVESARQTIAPQYRQSVETYFRVLSERGQKKQPAMTSSIASFTTLFLLVVAGLLPQTGVAGQEPKNTSADTKESADSVDDTVRRAIKYLISKQRADGAIVEHQNETTMTSLAIMAMASAGTTTSENSLRGEAMRKALQFVLTGDRQDKDGYYGNRDGSRMYGHGITTLMLTEMLGMGASQEQDALLHDRCQKAINLILSSQKQSKRVQDRGGWRYTPNSNDSDLSVSVWQLMALRSAKNDGLDVPSEAIQQAVDYLKRSYTTRLDSRGIPIGGPAGFSYIPDQNNPTYTMTAAGLLAMQVCGEYESPLVAGAADWLLAHPPQWNERFFFYGTYYYAQGMFQRGGEHAITADRMVRQLLLDRQQPDGSWTAPSGEEGGAGKVYSTSLAILSLSVKYHYLPIYQK